MSTQTENPKKHALDSGGEDSNSSDEWAGPKPSEVNQEADLEAGPLPPAPKKRKSDQFTSAETLIMSLLD